MSVVSDIQLSASRGNLYIIKGCTKKLQTMVELLMTDHLKKEEIVPSLTHAATVLEKVFLDRTKGLHFDDQDDIFSEASITNSELLSHIPEVPDKVQEWLTNTFTRRSSISVPKRRRLRSIATAVQASAYIDKLFKIKANGSSGVIQISIPDHVKQYMNKDILSWEFDPFELFNQSNGRPIRMMGLYLFDKLEFFDKFRIDLCVLENFLDMIEEGYKKNGNPYHNCTHSADVAQSCYYMIIQNKLTFWLNDLELFSVLFAALIHDYEHSGTTNNYHINSRSDLAVVYNDNSILEMYHVSAVFKKMLETNSNCNIVKNMSQHEYRQFRSMVIDMVLSTDMSTHFAQVQAMKDAIPCPENLPRVDILSYILHAADISHPAKVWHLHEKWTIQLTEEFFSQGDKEKEAGLPCSPLCDREKTLVSQSQVGFIEYIVEPCFYTLMQLMSGIRILRKPPAVKTEDSVEDATTEDDNTRPVNPTPDTSKGGIEQNWLAMQLICENRDRWKEKAEKDKRTIAAIKEEEEDTEQ